MGRKVISVSGDGSFAQYAMEFTTAVRHNMDITHVLLNNAELGKISKEQKAGQFESGRPIWSTHLLRPLPGNAAALGHGSRSQRDWSMR